MNKQFVITGEKYTRIPEGVRGINKETIKSSGCIEELYIPNSVELVELESLYCPNLTKLIIPAKFCLTTKESNKYAVAYLLHKKESVKSEGTNFLDDFMKQGKVHEEYDYTIAFFSFFKDMPIKLKELVIYGEEKELDLSSIRLEKCFSYNQKPIIRIENKVTHIELGDYPEGYQPLIYINNFIENVTIDAPAGWTPDCFIFRAPHPNQNELDDSAIELTLAPRCNFHNDTRWSCPIKINTAAVTYIHPVEITCFENDYQATRILLLGNRLDEIPIDKFSSDYMYPSIIVWEDMETVYNKLKQKGWTSSK